MKKGRTRGKNASKDKKEERLMSVGTFVSTRAMGDLVKASFDGEEGASGRFVGYLAVNGAATSTRTSITFSAVYAAVNQGFLAKVWNTGGTGIYTNARCSEISITLAPVVDIASQRSLTGGYAITGPRPGAAAVGGISDLLQLQESMLYVAPLRETTTYSISAMPFCTRPGRCLTYRVGGTEKAWIGTGGSPPGFLAQPIADLYYVGLGTGTETCYVYFSAKFDFKGFTAT